MTTTQQPSSFDFHAFAKELTATIADVLKKNNDELWDIEDIAEYLHCSVSSARQSFVVLPSFPVRIALPSAKNGRNGKRYLWKAKDVKNWVLQHQEKR